MSDIYFTPATFNFLRMLAANNTREWFTAHQQDYENQVRAPALDFISDTADELPVISQHFLASPRKVGGSLMRIHRDTRFSRDKTPYKTNIGIQFRHEAGKDIHAPGYYLHIAPDECFIGIGLWHPEPDALFRIREAITQQSESWVAARDNPEFRQHFTLEGESLSQAPRGFAKDHPLMEDLKRKDFIGMAPLSEAEVTSEHLLPLVIERFGQADPYMRFLCKALDIRF
jgi:uncharacterized protein (TIGR02453 family)